MNKYEKALEKLYSIAKTSDYYKLKRYDEPVKLIQELVDKETPKKPDYEGDGYSDGELVYDTWICPNCGKSYEVDYEEYERCPHCGQMIDWGK